MKFIQMLLSALDAFACVLSSKMVVRFRRLIRLHVSSKKNIGYKML